MSSNDVKSKKVEKTYQEEIVSVTKVHDQSLQLIVSSFDKINKAREVIFERIEKDDDAEDLMFEVADLKHEANVLYKNSIKAYKGAKATLEYIEAYLKMGKIDDILKNKGYEKITDTNRSMAVNSLKEVLAFKLMLAELESYKESSENLVENLLADEHDLRQKAKPQVGGF